MHSEESLPAVVMPGCPVHRLLVGQKALVTGANSGLGRAIALHLAHEGAAVAVNYVTDPEAADAVVTEIRGGGGEAIAVRTDVSSEAEVEQMFETVLATFSTLDILVNNAGIQADAPIDEMSLAQWERVLGVTSPASSSAPGRRSASSSGVGWSRRSPAPPARSSPSARSTRRSRGRVT